MRLMPSVQRLDAVTVGWLASGWALSPHERYPHLEFFNMRLKPLLAPLVWQFREDVHTRMNVKCAPLPSSSTKLESGAVEDSWLPKTVAIFNREVRNQTNKRGPQLSATSSRQKLDRLVKAAEDAGWRVTVIPHHPMNFVDEQLRAVANASVVVGEEGAAWGSISVSCVVGT